MKHMEMFTGRVGNVSDIKELANGNCVVNFSVAETPRVKVGETWGDGPTVWTNVAIFGDEARNLHRSVKPGTFVTVIGERRASEYIPKDSTEKVTSQSVVAEHVAISITRWHYVEGIGNVNYAKEGTQVSTPTQQSAPVNNTFNTPASSGTSPVDNDPFAENATDDDPFADDEDPFGLNS